MPGPGQAAAELLGGVERRPARCRSRTRRTRTPGRSSVTDVDAYGPVRMVGDDGGPYPAAMATQADGNPMKHRSREVTDGFERAPARAMLRAIGMTDDDWDKPQVAVASSWNEVTPCNMPLDRLAKRAKEGVRAAGGFPIEFTTIAVSDGISMGHEGMRASLVSAARSSPTRSRP